MTSSSQKTVMFFSFYIQVTLCLLANTGILIEESVGMSSAAMAVSNFTKCKRQLSSSEVERTREIANVRIHVEESSEWSETSTHYSREAYL